MKNKKAQQVFGMSFGIMFSIIIIIFIVVFGIMTINRILDSQACTKQGMFIDDLDQSVTNIWRSQGEYIFPEENLAVLPSKITMICFINYDENAENRLGVSEQELSTGKPKITQEMVQELELFTGNYNMMFYPTKEACELEGYLLKHIDIEKMTAEENPYCVPVKDGKIAIKIKKDSTSNLVVLSRTKR
jgi:hypothetical protein